MPAFRGGVRPTTGTASLRDISRPSVGQCGKLQGLGAPVASIGGAGTFDGVFLTGILAVLIASVSIRTKSRRSNHSSSTDAPHQTSPEESSRQSEV
jgi:hypothetical protein